MSLILSIAVLVSLYIMAPTSLKEKMLAALGQLIPQSVKDAAEPIIYTPSERRQKIINTIKEKLEEVKAVAAETVEENPTVQRVAEKIKNVIDAVEESEQLITKLEKINKEQSIPNKISTSIVDKIVEIMDPSAQKNKKEADVSASCKCEL